LIPGGLGFIHPNARQMGDALNVLQGKGHGLQSLLLAASRQLGVVAECCRAQRSKKCCQTGYQLPALHGAS